MRIDLLRARGLRCFEKVELAPGPRLNWLIGPNGSGKTTLLEAIYTLSHGHSFRSNGREAMIQRGRPGYDVYSEWQRESGRRHRTGLARRAGEWQIHVDGEPRDSLQPLFECCAAVCFEPGSHGLISGAVEERRKFLNWGVFHVERTPLEQWRDYRRALRQRNVLIRGGQADEQFPLWERELGRHAEQIESGRRSYLDKLLPHLARRAAELLPELGAVRLNYQAGWDTQANLAEQLAAQRDKDILRGYTRLGPHRADWGLVFEQAPGREYLSRGQTKLAAFLCVLAQASLFAEGVGEWPVICVDDLNAELDQPHQRMVLDCLAREPAQVWITATSRPHLDVSEPSSMFHVEHTKVALL